MTSMRAKTVNESYEPSILQDLFPEMKKDWDKISQWIELGSGDAEIVRKYIDDLKRLWKQGDYDFLEALDYERLKEIVDNLSEKAKLRVGFVHFVRSEDYHGASDTEVIPFSSEEELVKILKRNGAVDEDNVIAYKEEGDSYQGFPVDKWAEFVLDSIYGGMNGFMGNENDVYPFLYDGGWYGWVSKEERPEDIDEAKRRFHRR